MRVGKGGWGGDEARGGGGGVEERDRGVCVCVYMHA